MSPTDEVLARARAMLRDTPPEKAPTLPLLPKGVVPAPEPRPRYRRDLAGDEVKFVMRLQEGARLQVQQLANLHHRSMNSEFVMGMEWWVDRQTLMWTMLQATERELTRLEQLRKGEERKTLDDIAQRLPHAAAVVGQLKALIEQG